jgi:SMI1 / KNR4 family (SUKH-1)
LSSVSTEVFGSIAHRFELNPPVPEPEISIFEQEHGISLPLDYRQFLGRIGNGGAGPYYGIFPLGFCTRGSSRLEPFAEDDGLVGNLSKPFPLEEPWNDLSGDPDEALIKTNEADYWRQVEVFDSIYFATANVDGAIPICEEGCALRVWLVVTGKQTGRLWHDGRAERTGLTPLVLKSGSPATFSVWYQEWLDELLRPLA